MAGRNKGPSDLTIRILCGKAAGMCEFEGCNKRLFYDNITLKEFNNSFVAHIVASSVNGPRGDKQQSPILSDKIDNLMLMCADHHKLIDTDVENYPVDKLIKMKNEHEEKISNICSLFNLPASEIICFESPIKGSQVVKIDYKLASKAIIPLKQPASLYGQTLSIKSTYDYKSTNYWEDCINQLNTQFSICIFNQYSKMHHNSFSLFPIAPIPLIIKIGELFGDKIECDIYQKFRNPDTWNWQNKEKNNSFHLEVVENNNDSQDIAFIISLTSDISKDRIKNIDNFKCIYKITAENLSVDSIKSKNDLSEFWHLYLKACDEILNTYGKNVNVHLFPAIPVSAAFEIGRRYMPKIYPKLVIYDDCNGFFKTIEIGG